MSFNVQHGEAGLEKVAAVLRALKPDLVLLQEVDRGTGRSGGRDQAASLAQELGLVPHFAEAFPFEGGSYGVAILAPEKLTSMRIDHLPMNGNGEPRVLLSGAWNGVRWACTHLGLDDRERVDQARAILEQLGPFDPVVLAGDLNEGRNGPALHLLHRHFADAFVNSRDRDTATAPPDRPQTRIDHVLVSPHAPRPVDAFVGSAGASDHRPVVVDFEER